MPRERRPDRLGRDELLALQQKVLREWHESDWLAEHDPRAWEHVSEMHPDAVHVELGGGMGESEQEPGYIVVGEPAGPAGSEMAARTGERRSIDIPWDLNRPLPFENQSVDRYCLRYRTLRGLGEFAYRRLAAEMARTLVIGGTVDPRGLTVPGMTAAGFEPDEDGETFILTTQATPIEDAAPLLVADLPAPPRLPYAG